MPVRVQRGGEGLAPTHSQSGAGLDPLKKKWFPRKSQSAKNLHTKSERLIVSGRVTLAWSERVSVRTHHHQA